MNEKRRKQQQEDIEILEYAILLLDAELGDMPSDERLCEISIEMDELDIRIAEIRNRHFWENAYWISVQGHDFWLSEAECSTIHYLRDDIQQRWLH